MKPATPVTKCSCFSDWFSFYFRHSCTFCTPHFFYINSNKPTAGRTKAIHRRLELSFNLYLLLLLWVKTELPKSHPHITPQDFPLLVVFQQIKHLKDNSSRQNHLVIVGFLGCPYYFTGSIFSAVGSISPAMSSGYPNLILCCFCITITPDDLSPRVSHPRDLILRSFSARKYRWFSVLPLTKNILISPHRNSGDFVLWVTFRYQLSTNCSLLLSVLF